jgi:hypothetical protein
LKRIFLFHVAAKETPQGNKAACGISLEPLDWHTTIDVSNLCPRLENRPSSTVRAIAGLESWYTFVRYRFRPPKISCRQQGDLWTVNIKHSDRKARLREYLTCSSKDSDFANSRASALLSSVWVKVKLLLVGLSGGEISELGVVFVSALDRSSESSANLSETLSVEFDDIVLVAMGRMLVIMAHVACSNNVTQLSFPPPGELDVEIKGHDVTSRLLKLETAFKCGRGTVLFKD